MTVREVLYGALLLVFVGFGTAGVIRIILNHEQRLGVKWATATMTSMYFALASDFAYRIAAARLMETGFSGAAGDLLDTAGHNLVLTWTVVSALGIYFALHRKRQS
jgi:hypothetical protein